MVHLSLVLALNQTSSALAHFSLINRLSVTTVLITNRKSHTGLRLILTSMTMNSVIALILHFFPLNSIALLVNYVTMVEDKPIMSVKYCLPVFHFWPKRTHPAARSLRNSWATCTSLPWVCCLRDYLGLRQMSS